MKIKQSNRRAQSGFTLVETVFASLVMLVGLLTVAQMFVLAALYNQSAKQDTLATSLAHRKMEQLLAVPLDSPLIAFGGSLGANNTTAGYFENYYVDPATKQVGLNPFVAGQPVSYVVTWRVDPDNANPPMAGLRRLTVRAEATRAALVGLGVNPNNISVEVAELSTIRTTSQ